MNNEIVETIHRVIEWCAFGIELFAVCVIVAGVLLLAVTRGTVRYLFHLNEAGAYESHRQQLGMLRGYLMTCPGRLAQAIIPRAYRRGLINNCIVSTIGKRQPT